MPELPEVETVVRTLEKQLGNRKIKKVEVYWNNIIANVEPTDFKLSLKNQTIEKYDRRGKFLVFTLTDYILVSHLRMEGKFFIHPKKTKKDKHTHIIFELEDLELHYNDVRKFGKFYLYQKQENLSCLDKIGFEPFDENLNGRILKQLTKKDRMYIKTKLLDQSLIAGIGNIYANEICFKCGLDPLRRSCCLSERKWDEVLKATREVLVQAIQQGGTTIRSYTSSLGVSGLFQQSLMVHSRENEACYCCGSKILKKKVNGRGTYYCPICQKPEPIVVAITGCMGSGKSEVIDYLTQKGYKTVSSDNINAQLLKQNQTILDLADILKCNPDKINKKFLSKIIFSNQESKEKVEKYLHQKIYQEIEKWIYENESEKLLFVEVPLLYEVNWNKYFDCNVTVNSKIDLIYKRLLQNRNMSEKEINARLKSQFSPEKKVELADYVLENSSTLKKLFASIDSLIKRLI
ncbi:MAG: DNA-formamidopyrimidine glycosylase [Bacillota bacterium]|nr:DNA-formamidopyrimidine glycosylase [Bacillota bacterium]NLL25952.1 DNA-formamidopyrimidine glycosylase [Erysipelotrichia bacterium]